MQQFITKISDKGLDFSVGKRRVVVWAKEIEIVEYSLRRAVLVIFVGNKYKKITLDGSGSSVSGKLGGVDFELEIDPQQNGSNAIDAIFKSQRKLIQHFLQFPQLPS